MNKTKKALLDDCREHLVFAIGSAAGAGERETAARINAILIDIDIACEMCYTGKKARKARKDEEEKTMKTYTRHEYSGYDIYVSDDTNRVHHAVKINTANPTTLYPYEPCKTGLLDNCCDCYTLQQVKNRMKTGKIVFR